MSNKKDRGMAVRIVDLREFAKDVVSELNREDEQGTTSIHKLFDGAFERAVDNGSIGVELPGDELDGKGEGEGR